MVGVGGEKEGGSFFEQWMTINAEIPSLSTGREYVSAECSDTNRVSILPFPRS